LAPLFGRGRGRLNLYGSSLFLLQKIEKNTLKNGYRFLKSVLASFFSENELNSHLADYQSVVVLWVVLLACFVFPKLSDAISGAVRDEL
jgi:hypothetical protein